MVFGKVCPRSEPISVNAFSDSVTGAQEPPMNWKVFGRKPFSRPMIYRID